MQFNSGPGAEGVFSIYWEDILLGTIDERHAQPGVNQLEFGLPQTYGVGNYVLSFRVDPYAPVISAVSLDHVATGLAVIPAPPALIGGFCLLGGMAMRRTRHVMITASRSLF